MDDSALPVIPTIANQFADPGVDLLWERLSLILSERHGMILAARQPQLPESGMPEPQHIIPPERIHYLADISRTVRDYHSRTGEMAQKVRLVQQLEATARHMSSLADGTGSTLSTGAAAAVADIRIQADEIRNTIHPMVWSMIAGYEEKATQYRSGTYTYQVRGRDFSVEQQPNLWPTQASRRWRCQTLRMLVICWVGYGVKMYLGPSPTPPECFLQASG